VLKNYADENDLKLRQQIAHTNRRLQLEGYNRLRKIN
jgi:hypothetical protein